MEKNEVTTKNWYAMYTNSRAEKKVLELMVQQGIEAYLPVKKELHQWSDRKKWVEVPLINSYIFVRVEPQSMKELYNIRGVVAFVNDHGKPAIIPHKEMEAMQRTVDNKVAFTLEQNTLRKGERIRMTTGPLAGVEGEIQDIKGQTKLYLRVSHVGFSLVVDMEGCGFEKI